MSKYLRVIVLFSCMKGLFGCGRQDGGYAPGTPPPSSQPTESISNNFKYGETITTSGGWEISLDTTDPIQEVILANGWTVEVKYE